VVCRSRNIGDEYIMELKRRPVTPEVQENCRQKNQKECLSDIDCGNPMGSQLSPGGSSTTVTGKWKQHVTQHGSDPQLGRCSWVTVTGKGTRQTAFITAYRVCDQTPITHDSMCGPCRATDSSTKSLTAHTQQFSLIFEDNAECCDPRQAFITNLERFITSLTVYKNHDVILGIDANKTLYDKIGESAILGLIERCGLIDAMASMNPDNPPPPIRCDFMRRVDFIFATAGIHKNIIRYGMLPKDSIFYINHCALYIDIAVEPQFGPDSNRVVPQVHRKIQCRNPAIVSKYKECLKKKLAHHTIPECIDSLMAVPTGSSTKKHTAAEKKMIQLSATHKNSQRGSATRVRAESLTGQRNCLTQARS
jgi:hypothetical protein